MTAGTEHDRLALLVHEVRSPVSALVAIVEALTSDDLDQESVRELVRLALGACRGVDRIVGDAAVGSIRTESVDVARLVADVAAAATLRDPRVRADVGRAIPRIHADPVRLRQALDNLIVNAQTHSHSADAIVVGARVDGAAVLVSVSDRGGGIRDSEQARIFDAGVRLDPAAPGSGFGLAIVRAIVVAHGGTLAVESSVGQGSRFTIALPLRGS